MALAARWLVAPQPAPERWAADAVAPDSGSVTVFQAPADLPRLLRTPIGAPREGYSISDPVVAPDGTVWTLQDRRYFEIDNQQLDGFDSRGRTLLALRPDGTVDVVETPYDGNDEGVRPLCAAADGTLYAQTITSAVAALGPDGEWREITGPFTFGDTQGRPPRNEGGPAIDTYVQANGCVVEADGDLLLLDGCTVRRVDAAGVITTIAGREGPGTDNVLFGCGEASSRENSVPSPEPLVINGPATAADLPRMESIAAGPDGTVWLGSLVGLRRLDRQPDGTYMITTVQTRAFGRQENVIWSVTPDSLTDIAPLDDGRVLVLTRTSLLVLGVDGVLRGTDRRDHRWIAIRNSELLSVGPVPDGGDGLRLAKAPV